MESIIFGLLMSLSIPAYAQCGFDADNNWSCGAGITPLQAFEAKKSVMPMKSSEPVDAVRA